MGLSQLNPLSIYKHDNGKGLASVPTKGTGKTAAFACSEKDPEVTPLGLSWQRHVLMKKCSLRIRASSAAAPTLSAGAAFTPLLHISCSGLGGEDAN